MKYLEKTWVRIVVALLAASFISVMIDINSDDPNHLHSKDNSSMFILIFAPIIFLGLTAYVKSKGKKPFKLK